MPDLNSLPPSRPTTTSNSPNSARSTAPLNTTTHTTTQQPIHTPSPTSTRPAFHTRNSSNASPRLPTSNSPRLSGTPRRIGSISLPSAMDPASSSPSRRGSSSRNSPALTSANLQAFADPHHHRQPSLGELHQELEEEQEAQVNRLLHQIRDQQATIMALSAERDASRERSSAVADEPGSAGLNMSRSSSRAGGMPVGTTPFPSLRTRGSDVSLGRRSSTRSRGGSPFPGGGFGVGVGNGEGDEVGRMEEESRMVMRENQMLKGRIRELERLVAEARGSGGGSGSSGESGNGTQ